MKYYRNRRYEISAGVMRRADPIARTIELETEGKTVLLDLKKIAGIECEWK